MEEVKRMTKRERNELRKQKAIRRERMKKIKFITVMILSIGLMAGMIYWL